jgi:3-hydroxymyristoyl/3-hydroxydecanoyl-(acyl carrier protein) dehydratase
MVEEIKSSLENLAVKKSWKINFEGKKIKVVRKDISAFDIYLNGHFVTADESWERAFELVQVLLDDK